MLFTRTRAVCRTFHQSVTEIMHCRFSLVELRISFVQHCSRLPAEILTASLSTHEIRILGNRNLG